MPTPPMPTKCTRCTRRLIARPRCGRAGAAAPPDLARPRRAARARARPRPCARARAGSRSSAHELALEPRRELARPAHHHARAGALELARVGDLVVVGCVRIRERGSRRRPRDTDLGDGPARRATHQVRARQALGQVVEERGHLGAARPRRRRPRASRPGRPAPVWWVIASLGIARSRGSAAHDRAVDRARALAAAGDERAAACRRCRGRARAACARTGRPVSTRAARGEERDRVLERDEHRASRSGRAGGSRGPGRAFGSSSAVGMPSVSAAATARHRRVAAHADHEVGARSRGAAARARSTPRSEHARGRAAPRASPRPVTCAARHEVERVARGGHVARLEPALGADEAHVRVGLAPCGSPRPARARGRCVRRCHRPRAPSTSAIPPSRACSAAPRSGSARSPPGSRPATCRRTRRSGSVLPLVGSSAHRDARR